MGRSINNPGPLSLYEIIPAKAIIVPRTDGFTVTNNFLRKDYMIIIL